MIYEAVLRAPSALFCRHGMTHTDDLGGRLRARLWTDTTVMAEFPCGCTVPVAWTHIERLEGVFEDGEKEQLLYPVIRQLTEEDRSR